MLTKPLTSFAVALTLFATAAPVFAADEYNVINGPTLQGSPLGVHGVDPVALSTLGAVAPGDAQFTVAHDGVAYYFASQRTADMFAEAPDQFLPQFGGFCAFAVALGKKLDGDPRYADIVDGKLYLFVNAAVFAKYQENPEETRATAYEKWDAIHHEPIGNL